jgi:uncharacterized protein
LRGGISPSEDRGKVLAAARSIFGECSYQVEERDDAVVLHSSEIGCLQKIHDQLRDRRVRNAARRLLLKSLEGTEMRILFNRQAAFVGVIAVVSTGEESPLGPLVLELKTEKPVELIDWLAPYRAAEPQ